MKTSSAAAAATRDPVFGATPVILDNLIAASRIPPTVAVFVDNPDQATRTRELTESGFP